MAKKERSRRAGGASVSAKQSEKFRNELRAAFWIALPVSIVSVLFVLWPSLFPVPAQQLIEVAWTHSCSCAHGWIESLREQGFVVRDYELEDTLTQRRRWGVPEKVSGCHPALYLGYFLDGHIPVAMLRRLEKERPPALGLQKVDIVKEVKDGKPLITGSQYFLLDANGESTEWK